MLKEDIRLIYRAVFSFVLACLSTFSYIYLTRLNIIYPVPEYFSLMGFTIGDIIVLALYSIAYFRFLNLRHRLNIYLLLLSTILGICAIALGEIYRFGGAEIASSIFAHSFFYLLCFLGMFFAIYMALYMLINFIKNNISKNTENINISTMHLSLAIYFIYMLGYLLFFFPGASRWESGLVIGFIEGKFLARQVAPAFYQLFISLFISLGKLLNSDTVGLILYFACLALVCAIAQALIIKRLFKLKISRYFKYFFLIFCIFNPLVFMQTFIMSYDTLLAIAMLYFSIAIYDSIYEEFCIKNLVKLFFASLALCAFRNVGLAILIAFIISSLYFFIKRFSLKGLIMIFSMLIAGLIFYIGNNIAFCAMNITRKEDLASHSTMLYQLGYTLHKHGTSALTDEEKDILSPYVDIEKIGNNYYQNVADSVKYQFLYHENPYEKHLAEGGEQAVVSVWASLGKRYTMDYISAFIKSCYKFVIPGFFEETNDWGKWQHAPMHMEGIEKIDSYKPYLNQNSKYRESNTLFLGYTSIYGAFMSSGYIFMFVFITLAILIYYRKNILPILPAIIYCIGILFSPVNGWLRYAVPAGFAVAMCMLLIFKAYGEKYE